MQSTRNPGKKTFEIRLKMEGEVSYEGVGGASRDAPCPSRWWGHKVA